MWKIPPKRDRPVAPLGLWFGLSCAFYTPVAPPGLCGIGLLMFYTRVALPRLCSGSEGTSPLRNCGFTYRKAAFQMRITVTFLMILALFSPNALAVAESPVAKFVGHTDRVRSVAFSPDGSLLASGSYDKTVLLWKVETGSRRAIHTGHKGGIVAVTFSPNGTRVISASLDGTVRLWDTETGVHRADAHWT